MSGTKLHREMIKQLQYENMCLKSEVRILRSAERGNAMRDGQELDLRLKLMGALEAVQVLSPVVEKSTRRGRAARAEARQLLEGRGLKPPATLGSTRKAPKKKRRRSKRLTKNRT